MPSVKDKYKKGDIIEYSTCGRNDKFNINGPVKCRAIVDAVYTNGIVRFTNCWMDTFGTLLAGMTETRPAESIRKMSDEEIMLWKLEQ